MGTKKRMEKDLRRRRLNLHFTQEEFARAIGISPRTIQRIEAGQTASMLVTRTIEKELSRMEKSRTMIR